MTIGQMTKHRSLGLSDEKAVLMYELMVKARKFDEMVMLLQRTGKVAFFVSGIGQEVCQVAAAMALEPHKDYFLPYYRDFGFVLSVGMTLKELMLSAFSKADDPTSGGRQMVGHFSHKQHHIVTGSSPVTTQVPHAVGFALAAKMKKQDFVSYVTFGEGSSNQGDFHEGCNFAGVKKLPVIFLCENNQYAISIPAHKQLGGKVSDRAQGYGFPGIRVDGNDALEVFRVVKEARERAVRGDGPTLIEAMMYRLSPHSTSDNDLLYRTKEEVEAQRKLDGIPRFRDYLIECGLWNEEKDRELLAAVDREVREAAKFAEDAPHARMEDLHRHLYAETEEI
ncbi:thiamine pyrophosphate-dependent dehydrogenase E1 component subunit alpha [Gorillibacterium sp. sgz500922]|uniref:thiamine pyrophosphate-dependent dehydrogenase E1 component subunit alpha n=1 Tax=Gorillibacterium sp. sgz500922 TaxID=3446694 RepID=UPI003F66FB24